MLAPVVKGQFLSGNPISGETLEYQLEINPGIYPELFPDPVLRFYSFGVTDNFRQQPKTLQDRVTFDHRGTCRLNIKPSAYQHFKCLSRFFLKVRAITAEGKEQYITAPPGLIFPGGRVTGIRLPHTIKSNQTVKAEVIVIDPFGRPAEARADIKIINRVNYR